VPLSEMAPSLVLASQSALLIVNLKCDICTMEISKDLKSLVFESKPPEILSAVKIRLSDDDGKEIFSPLISRFRGDGTIEFIRIDAIYPLIFDCEESIDLVPDRVGLHFSWSHQPQFNKYDIRCLQMLSWFGDKVFKRRNMRISLAFRKESTVIPQECITKIRTSALTVDNNVIPVSKELLSIRSPYFETIFYRDFSEKISGIYEIKEVDEAHLRSFIEYLHGREREQRIFQRSKVQLALLRTPIDLVSLAFMSKPFPSSRASSYHKIRSKNYSSLAHDSATMMT
ncbi:hypothetical protein PENTCL1PPCAC_25480, partial [Pristionchus entomophagus]